MTTWIPLMIFAMIANCITIFVMFAPPAHEVFPRHPECSITFSPDLTQKQKAFCRELNRNGQK